MKEKRIVSCTKLGGMDCVPSITRCEDCSPDLYKVKYPDAPKMLDRKISTFEGWTYYAFQTKEDEEWLTDVLKQLLIDNRPVSKEILEKITDMDGPM